MNSVLIVAKSKKTTQCLVEIMKDEGYSDCKVSESATETKKFVKDNAFDLIFIYTPLTDEVGLNLSVYMTEHTNSGVFVAVSESTAEKISDKLSSKGVVTLIKPVSVEAVHHSLLAFRAMQCRMGIMEEKNQKLITQLEEIKIINRAKLVLMQCLAMSEQQAHRYIEKQAMDLRVTKKYVAQQVLNIYET